MEDYGYVRVYNNGELFVDEYLAKFIKYTDSYREFMEFCFDLWKNKTNQKIFPSCIVLSCKIVGFDERIVYGNFSDSNFLVQ